MIIANISRAKVLRQSRVVQFALVLVMLVAVVMRARAQTPLPEISVSPPQKPPTSIEQPDRRGSGEAKGDGEAKERDRRLLEQLNQQLKRKVDEANPVLNTPPLDAGSPDTKTGVINIPGVKQQYGKNFGNSVIPYRPSAPVYSSPVGRH